MKSTPIIIVLLIGIGLLAYIFLSKQNNDENLNTQDESSFVEEENNAPQTPPITQTPPPVTNPPAQGGSSTTTIMAPVIVLNESDYASADFGNFACGAYIKFIPKEVPQTQAVLAATYKWLFDNNYQTSQYHNLVPGMQPNLNFQSVEIVNGVAKVYLTGSVMEYGCAFAAFAGQIEQAALQYPTVNDIQVYLNGQLFDWCSISQADPEEDGCDTTPRPWDTQKIFEI